MNFINKDIDYLIYNKIFKVLKVFILYEKII